MSYTPIGTVFTDTLFLSTIDTLKHQFKYQITESGDLQFTDKAGNWLHICNLINNMNKSIGIVSQRIDEERCDGAAYQLTDDYGQALYDEVRRVFGI